MASTHRPTNSPAGSRYLIALILVNDPSPDIATKMAVSAKPIAIKKIISIYLIPPAGDRVLPRRSDRRCSHHKPVWSFSRYFFMYEALSHMTHRFSATYRLLMISITRLIKNRNGFFVFTPAAVMIAKAAKII